MKTSDEPDKDSFSPSPVYGGWNAVVSPRFQDSHQEGDSVAENDKKVEFDDQQEIITKESLERTEPESETDVHFSPKEDIVVGKPVRPPSLPDVSSSKGVLYSSTVSLVHS